MNDILDHLPRLRRYARALTGDRAAADDLVQDTVERALSRSALFARGSRLDAWLMTMMHNLYMSQMRQAASRPAFTPYDELIAEPAALATGAERLALRDLEKALSMLPLEQRETLLLVSLEEFSYEDTARILGVPVGTVMSRLSRARQRLRELLAGAPVAGRDAPLKVVK
jgi:RNA polymerase sigma-70 factor (ECF subfamily)